MKVVSFLLLTFLLFFPAHLYSQQNVTGQVTITMLATDPVVAGQGTSGVTSVLVLLDGNTLGSATLISPNTYTLPWASYTTSNGLHTLTAKATDNAGNVGTATLQVNVQNGVAPDITPPVIQFVTPIAGSTVTGKFNVTSKSSDNVGVSQMQLFIRGSLRKTVNSNSLSYSWNTASDKKYSPISLTTTAIDPSGNLASQTIVVRIN